jgi:hypothetical protein
MNYIINIKSHQVVYRGTPQQCHNLLKKYRGSGRRYRMVQTLQEIPRNYIFTYVLNDLEDVRAGKLVRATSSV